MLQAPRGVAFDLDGTLLDSRLDIAAACNHVLRWAGRDALPVATISGFVGDGARSLLCRAFELSRDDPYVDELLPEWRRYYVEHPVEQSRWMPGAERALAQVAARGIPLALVTNKARVVTLAILKALALEGRFAFVYAGGDGPLKPSPECMLRAAAAFGVAPGALWIVGDAVQDIGAGKAAGCETIAVAGGFHAEAALRDASPSALLPSLLELESLL